jgi:WD40 repeat protein
MEFFFLLDILLLFLKYFKLITCADNSNIGAWDIESGRKAYFILDAHDGEETTCISIDRPCRKLATGARNGVIKVIKNKSFFFSSIFAFVCTDLE